MSCAPGITFHSHSMCCETRCHIPRNPGRAFYPARPWGTHAPVAAEVGGDPAERWSRASQASPRSEDFLTDVELRVRGKFIE